MHTKPFKRGGYFPGINFENSPPLSSENFSSAPAARKKCVMYGKVLFLNVTRGDLFTCQKKTFFLSQIDIFQNVSSKFFSASGGFRTRLHTKPCKRGGTFRKLINLGHDYSHTSKRPTEISEGSNKRGGSYFH